MGTIVYRVVIYEWEYGLYAEEGGDDESDLDSEVEEDSDGTPRIPRRHFTQVDVGHHRTRTHKHSCKLN